MEKRIPARAVTGSPHNNQRDAHVTQLTAKTSDT